MSITLIWGLAWPIIKDFVSKYYLQIITVAIILFLSLFAWFEHSSMVSLKQEMVNQNAKSQEVFVHNLTDQLQKQTERDVQLSQQMQDIQVNYEQRMQESIELYQQQNRELAAAQVVAIDELNKQKKKKIADTTISTTLDPNQRVKSIADKYGFKVVP